MARNPDPALKLTTSKGVTRTLDDWTTMFHLCLVILPDRLEASRWVPVADRIFRTFGDADCHTAFVVTGNDRIAARILEADANRYMAFVDPDRELVTSLGLTHLPAFVHLRQDTTVVAAAEGWDPREWKRVATEIGRVMAWSVPDIEGPGDPPVTPGWPVP